MQQTFGRDFAELTRVFNLMDAFSAQQELGPSLSFPLTMAVEELFTNMVKYNAEGGAIEIECTGGPERVQIRLLDRDSAPFDVTEDRQVDTSASLHERTPGGLGLHLVQKMMDEFHYDHKDRVTDIRIVKYR
ncbi:MAG: ATP-binding protein [Rhodothermales bacterium]|nr:ATP-binding protein [Rhodothermales bacterium]